MSLQYDHIKSDKSLFESNEKTDKVRKLITRTLEDASAQIHLDAAKDLIAFNMEKARQFLAVEEQALKRLEAMSLKYHQQVTEEKSVHEKTVKDLRERLEVLVSGYQVDG